MSDADKLTTRSQVAQYLKVSRMTLYRMEKVLKLPQFWSVKRGHIQRLSYEDIKQWKDQFFKESARLQHAGRYPPAVM